MKRLVLAALGSPLPLLLALVTSAAACGDGFSTEDAVADCNQEEAALASAGSDCFDDAVHAECVACHEECGDGCATVDSVCPVTFSCPSDD